jgi:predicted dehydrogenase
MPAVTLRVGVLGAARIAPVALVRPARAEPDVEVHAVAARDPARAAAFAGKHQIPVVHRSYEDLLADPDVDAVYNPLPNGLHGHWTTRAIEAGKHVLCEKPFTANADEAELVAKVARDHPDVVVMEAFHYRYHPLVARLLEILESGALGEVRQIDATMTIAVLRPRDIRWQLSLAGGALMDVGCYTVHLVRTLAGAEPTVVSARARCSSPGVDRWTTASLEFPGGRTGTITCALLGGSLLRLNAKVVGSEGELKVLNPYAPQYFHRISWTSGASRHRERVTREPTYAFQLRAFAAAVAGGPPPITGVEDSVATMRVLDAAYRAAGLEPRTPAVTG